MKKKFERLTMKTPPMFLLLCALISCGNNQNRPFKNVVTIQNGFIHAESNERNYSLNPYAITNISQVEDSVDFETGDIYYNIKGWKVEELENLINQAEKEK
jgi:hypothetical protein